MNVLILVMSARKEPYGALMDAQMQTWDRDEHSQTKTFFYCGKGAEWREPEDYVFYSPNYGESLEEVSQRTIEAFEKSLELEWDYMARVHSSTYVHKNNLVKFCHTLPKHKVLCGIMTEGDKPFIWGGAHYIFSRDVIQKMVDNKDKWNPYVMEDQSITLLAWQLGIPVSQGHSATINLLPDNTYLCLVYGRGENYTFRDFSEIKDDGHFFFRVKQDQRRSEDIRIMHELHKHLP